MVGAPALTLGGLGATAAHAGIENCQLGSASFYGDLNYDTLSGYTERWATSGSLSGDFAHMDNKSTSIAANGQTCHVTWFFDALYPDPATSHRVVLYSKSRVGYNFRDPDLRNGAGVGDNANGNWDDRISSHQFTDCR